MIFVLHIHIFNANSGFHEGKRFNFQSEAKRAAFLNICATSQELQISDVREWTEPVYSNTSDPLAAAQEVRDRPVTEARKPGAPLIIPKN